jgi:hypothetical protein
MSCCGVRRLPDAVQIRLAGDPRGRAACVSAGDVVQKAVATTIAVAHAMEISNDSV